MLKQSLSKDCVRLMTTTQAILSQPSFYSSTVNPSTRFVNALIYALLAGVGAYRIMMGSTLTIGRLVTFLNYVQQYTKPFK